MSAMKEDIIGTIREAQQEVERIVSSAPESAWSKLAYEQGWNAKQLLCHIGSTGGVASLLLSMAKTPASGGPEGGFDNDAWNEQEVAARQDKSIGETLDEIRGNCQRNIEAVQNAPDDLLAQQFRAPWGTEGALGDVIVGSIQGHFMMHVRDLAAVMG